MESKEGKPMKLDVVVDYYPGETGKYLKVIEDRCMACGKCAEICPLKVWEQVGNNYKPTGLKQCAECGACWNVCESDAIDFNEPAGGTGVRFTYG
jgi:ferredoxin-like protein FixX